MSDPETTQHRWQFKLIPAELKAIKQWNLCYLPGQKDSKGNPITTAKRPIGGPRNQLTMRGFEDAKAALKAGQYFGFCVAQGDQLVCIDVDHLKEDFGFTDLPVTIQTILTTQPTYAEISPSGQGLHIFYRVDKTQLTHRKDQDKSTNGFEGSVFFRNQFVTVTGHRFESDYTTDDIQDISHVLFENVVLINQSLPNRDLTTKQRGLIASKPNYTIEDVERWLTKIPPNLSESSLQPLLNRAYAHFSPPITNPEDYMHWQYCAAAVHYAAYQLGQVSEGEDIFTEWSMQGTNDGEQNIRQKYRDNPPSSGEGNDLTHLTLVRLAAAVKPQWPFPKMKSVKGELIPTDAPDTENLLNWECLLNLYTLKLAQNDITKDYRVEAPAQIKSRYFDKTYSDNGPLESALCYFAQANSMDKARPSHANAATKWWVHEGAVQYNPIKEWIDAAPPSNKKDGSWFQALWETLELYPHDRANEDLYRSYMKKNLMGIIRAHYYTGQYTPTTGIVILQGAESTRKSTWVTQLLPQSLQEYVFPSQAELGKNAKEISLEAGICQIWLKDEVEAFISGGQGVKNADSVLKSFLVQSHDAYRPLFGTTPIQAKRKCIFFGTTNEQELALSSTGNRRIQIIPIKFCDTSAQAKISMVKVYKELLEEFLATPAKRQPDLWKLSAEEETLTDEINNSERKLESGGDIQIQDVFDFDAPFDTTPYLTVTGGTLDYTKLWKQKDIAATIYKRTGEKPTAAALKHILKRQVGSWSGTMKRFQELGAWSIEYGMAKKRSKGKVKQSGYIMPPEIDPTVPFEKDME